MRKVIVSTHGDISLEMKNTLCLFDSNVEITTISLKPDDDLNIYYSKVKNEIMDMNYDEYLVFVDIFGGTPCNKILEIINRNKEYYTDKNISIISGVNLPMLIETILVCKDKDYNEAVQVSYSSGKDSIKLFKPF